MDVLFLMSIFRLCPGLQLSFEHNSVRKNLFLSARFCWDSRLSLREMDQKFNFCRSNWLWGLLLGVFLVVLKLFRLHAILLDAAGAHSGKRPSYFYKIRGGPNSCLPGHVTTTPPPLRKTFAALHFQLCQLLNQYVLYCTRYWNGG